MRETTIASVTVFIFAAIMGVLGYVFSKGLAGSETGGNLDVAVVVGAVGGAIFGAIWATAILIVSAVGRGPK